MKDAERWFRAWRAWLWVLGLVLLLALVGSMFDGRRFSWATLALAAANLTSGYFGFARKRRLAIGLAVTWTVLDFLVLAWFVLFTFLQYVLSTGNWNFSVQ